MLSRKEEDNNEYEELLQEEYLQVFRREKEEMQKLEHEEAYYRILANKARGERRKRAAVSHAMHLKLKPAIMDLIEKTQIDG